MLTILVIYLFIGIIWVIADVRQPYHNQPAYIRKKNLFTISMYIFTWPMRLFFEIQYWILKFSNRNKK